jgi:protocatechuate 3,4-dioxygenase beta subunit
MTDTPVSRRRAMITVGTGAVAALLAACSKSTETQATPSTTAPASRAATGTSGAPGSSTTTPATPPTSAPASGGAACTITPELTEGPFYLDLDLVRQDITEGRQGTPLELTFTALSADGCTPLQDAAVDIWHCDAEGAYSGVSGGGGPGGGGGRRGGSSGSSSGTFLRGTQVTDAQGRATFKTIYPGWYQGRAVHIHFKVHPSANQEMTGQLFFPDDVNNEVFETGVYANRGEADVANARDSIYGQSRGATLVTPVRSGDGYTASITVTVGGGGSDRRRV